MSKFEKPKMSELVSRSFSQYRAESTEDGIGHITGVPIVFEQKTDIGGWFARNEVFIRTSFRTWFLFQHYLLRRLTFLI